MLLPRSILTLGSNNQGTHVFVCDQDATKISPLSTDTLLLSLHVRGRENSGYFSVLLCDSILQFLMSYKVKFNKWLTKVC